MFKNIKRLGASFIIAALILPHFALATSLTPYDAVCIDDGVDGNDTADTPCDNFTPSLVIDGNDLTGDHIQGPEYPIILTIDLVDDLENDDPVTVSTLTITHNNATGNQIAETTTGESAKNKVQWLNGEDWQNFGLIESDDDVSTIVTKMVGVGTVTTKRMRVVNWANSVYEAGWQPTEFLVTLDDGPTVPEMGVWALLVILPIMGYVVYQSTPKVRPTAI